MTWQQIINPTGVPQGQTPGRLKGGKAMTRQSKRFHGKVPRRGSDLQIDSALLSPVEVKILLQMASGETDKQIAESMSVSPRTVVTQLSGIFKKINAPNRLQAVLWAAKHLESAI
jgi:DNA-binding CsgD family transcriptional regulator